MADVTLAQAQAQLDAWLACSLAVAENQAYTIEGDGTSRTFTKANAFFILDQIRYWRTEVQRLSSPSGASGSRRRVRYVVPN